MRRPRWRRLPLAVAVLFGLAAALPSAAFAAPTGNVAEGAEPAAAEDEEEGLGPAEPDGILLRQRAAPRRTIPRGAYQDALAAARQLRATQAGDPIFTGHAWEFAGPERVGGRVVDIAVDTDEPGVVYAAAATGGIWKSIETPG